MNAYIVAGVTVAAIHFGVLAGVGGGAPRARQALAGPTRRGTVSAPAMTLFAMTNASGVTHLVTDEAMATGRPIGCYAAVCGSQVLAASLTTPERGYCQPCHRVRAGR